MIARAFVRQNPFEVWGNGEQIRNWTYIDDIVEGTILAAEKIDDGTAVNLGTMERIRVIDAARQVIDAHRPRRRDRRHCPDMPTGPLNRVADNSLSRRAARLAAEDAVRGRASGGPSSGISRRTNVTLWSSWSSRVA